MLKIGSLFKPIAHAAKKAADDVQEVVKSARHDTKRKNFDRRVSLKSVKAIKPAIAEAPRPDMDDAEFALMNDVRGVLNRLTARRSAAPSPEDFENHARDLWELMTSASKKAKERGLPMSEMLEQALKDATAGLPSGELRLLRVRAVELYGYLGQREGGVMGIRNRMRALGLVIDTCNDRIIAKGYRSVFLGPHARTREEKAIDRSIAAPLYGDTLVGPSQDLVAAINNGAKVNEVQALIARLASGYKSFGDELLFRSVFDAFKHEMPDVSRNDLIDAIGRRAVALLEMGESQAGRDGYLHAWLMLKVHNAYHAARTGEDRRDRNGNIRLVYDAAIPQPEPTIADRYWAPEYRLSLSLNAEAKAVETKELAPEQLRLLIISSLAAIQHRDWSHAYIHLEALSALDWSDGTIAEMAKRAFDEQAVPEDPAARSRKLSYARKLTAAVKNRFYEDESQQEPKSGADESERQKLKSGADESKWRRALQVSATMSVLNAIYLKKAGLPFRADDNNEMRVSEDDIEDCLAVLNGERPVQVNEPARMLPTPNDKGKEPERPRIENAAEHDPTDRGAGWSGEENHVDPSSTLLESREEAASIVGARLLDSIEQVDIDGYVAGLKEVGRRMDAGEKEMIEDAIESAFDERLSASRRKISRFAPGVHAAAILRGDIDERHRNLSATIADGASPKGVKKRATRLQARGQKKARVLPRLARPRSSEAADFPAAGSGGSQAATIGARRK